MKIFKCQTALRITVKTFCNLDGVSSAAIKFRKPNGKIGELSAAVKDIPNGIIFHEVIEGEIDISGWWSFWAYITFDDGRSAAGEASKVFVWEEGR